MSCYWCRVFVVVGLLYANLPDTLPAGGFLEKAVHVHIGRPVKDMVRE